MGPLQLSHLTPLLPLIPHLYSEDNKGQGLSDGGGGLGGLEQLEDGCGDAVIPGGNVERSP